MASNSRIIDLQNGTSITITVSLPDVSPDNESDDESDDEVGEMCCVECSKTIPTGDKFFTCHYDDAVMEYCPDCFKQDAICDNSECADCSAYRATHPEPESDDEVEEVLCVECDKTIPTGDKFFTCHYKGTAMEYCPDCFTLDTTCDNSECADCVAFREPFPVCGCCGDVLEHDMNMGACMCGDNSAICQDCGTWCVEQSEWICGVGFCKRGEDLYDSDDDDDSDDECEHKCDKCDKNFSSKGKMVVMCVAGKDGKADKYTCYECVGQMTGEIKDKIAELNKFPMTFVPEAEDEDEDDDEDDDENDDVNCAVCRTEILGNAFWCDGVEALMCSDCFDEHPKCSRSQRANKACDECERTMEADESDYDSDEYEAVVEQRKKMCLRVGEALMAEMDSSIAIMPAKPLMEDDEFNCAGCGKEDVPMDTMFLIDYVLNDDGTFEDGGRVRCSCCADEFRQAQHRRQRDSSLVVTDNAPNHETEELD